PPRPPACIFLSDYIRAGLMQGLPILGFSIPGDIPLPPVGVQPFAEMRRPPLTMLAPPFEQMGELATRTVLKMVEGGEGQPAALPPVLVSRQSVREIKGE